MVTFKADAFSEIQSLSRRCQIYYQAIFHFTSSILKAASVIYLKKTLSEAGNTLIYDIKSDEFLKAAEDPMLENARILT